MLNRELESSGRESNPKMLIKFVSERAHADCLVAGNLYMRPAMYYHRLEKGQGDDMEGAIDN